MSYKSHTDIENSLSSSIVFSHILQMKLTIIGCNFSRNNIMGNQKIYLTNELLTRSYLAKGSSAINIDSLDRVGRKTMM